MLRRLRGRLDEGNRQFVRGWAASGRQPVDVTVSVRGARFTVAPTEERPDLAPLGLPLRSGFMFIFPEPLIAGDSVQVFFANGKEIQNSPFVYSEDEVEPVLRGGQSAAFSGEFPSHQNSIDIFRGRWASAMPKDSGLDSGGIEPHFEDTRIQWAASVLGSLKGKSILELGPFEAYNSYQLERLGAEVLSIEGSLSNFLKCLIIKNVLSLSATFLFGDFVRFVQGTTQRFDICWASGVLYHSKEPVQLLKGVCTVAPIVFFWTHYFDQEVVSRSPEQLRFFRSNLDKQVIEADREITLHYRSYVQQKGRVFSGGPEEYSYWMTKDDILAVLAEAGFVHIAMGADHPHFSRGPACFFLASKFPLA